ncbi:MAG: enoyl-CoA hydratase-related protein [Kangiellaceae bacterium]|nr:enoyl-CoA hydratase-related protein [Kangiellaceae bacterium]MCW8998519.1 enoyl-CoA hydratase-related protein [Kangiellaceae bacterium]MCW9015785.1 enoyl-CoA hydratase-related protein [Kangiellaceae bacterium]
MSDELILVKQNNAVLEIQINRPDKMNALTDAMYAAINNALDNASNDDEIKLVYLRSSGAHFSAGNDLADFLQTDFNLESNVVQFLLKLAALEKPVVAAINGAAVGIGLTMLLHCDIVFASADVKLSVPFVKLGLTPEGGSSQLLAQRCGDLKANEWLLTGRTILAEEAAGTGLVNQVFDSAEDLWQASDSLTQKMAKSSLDILLASKQLLKGEQREEVLALIKKEATIFGQRLKTDEAKAAFDAFLNR